MYFTGDGAMRDAVGYYRITGRVDDVIIVSGHNLGTAPIEDSINEHPAVAEVPLVGFPHDVKGNALYGYVILKETGESRDRDNLRRRSTSKSPSKSAQLPNWTKFNSYPDYPKHEVARLCGVS